MVLIDLDELNTMIKIVFNGKNLLMSVLKS